MILLGILVLIIIGVWMRMLNECRHFKVEQYDIVSDKLPKAFHGFKIVMLADLHNHSFGNQNESVIRAIDQLQPDVIMLAGDMIEANKGKTIDNAKHLIETLGRRYEVIMANGNHEQRLLLYPEEYRELTNEWETYISTAPIQLLRNESMTLCRGNDQLKISGLELDRIYYQRFNLHPMDDAYMDKKLGKIEQKCYNILIAHNPFYFEQYEKWGADLVLSGHVHGGVIILPILGGLISPQVRLFPKYYAGIYKINKSIMILSRGLYMHSIRLRLFNRPEISSITLKTDKNGEI